MRERLTKEHGTFTFDSGWLAESGKVMQKVFFDMTSVNADFQQQSASEKEIVVD